MVPIIIAIAVIGVVWWIWALGGNNGKNKKSESVKKSSNRKLNKTSQKPTISTKIQLSDIPIEDNVILYTTSNKKIIITDGLLSPEEIFGAKGISNTYNNGYGKIVFASKVTQIGTNAFKGCPCLESVKIPNSVTSIGGGAFFRCTSLKSVIIPSSVTSIGDSAFSRCTSLKSVIIPSSVTSIGEYAFDDCTSLTSIAIPDSVTTIGDGAFHDCTSLIKVQITDLSAWCRIHFNGYLANPMAPKGAKLHLNGRELTKLDIPYDITEIKSHAFYNCISLQNVIIGNNVTTIGEFALSRCTSLQSVSIGSGVTTIEDAAFANSLSLKSVYCKAIVPPKCRRNIFFDFIKTSEIIGCKIYVPRASVGAYKVADGWDIYADNIVGYDF